MSFLGHHPEWTGCEYPDPLVVYPVSVALTELAVRWGGFPGLGRQPCDHTWPIAELIEGLGLEPPQG